MASKEDGFKNLQLFGEQINLSSRTRLGDDTKKFRPQSALYASTKYTPEHNRRPFSAGTQPTSPKLLSFLRHTQTDRPDSYYLRNSEYFKDFSIPGSVESSTLCEKLIKESIPSSDFTNRRLYYEVSNNQCNFSDNYSDNSSLETCISLGTKIKAKAQIFDKSPNMNDCEIEGTSMSLKKNRPYSNLSVERYFDNDVFKMSLNIIPEKDYNSSNSKLMIHLPTTKEENTSSGVSSSSDIHTFSNNQNKKSILEFIDTNKKDSKREESLSLHRSMSKRDINRSTNSFLENRGKSINSIDLININSEKFSTNENQEPNKNFDSLAGRVSFANHRIEEEEEALENFDDSYDIFSTFDTQLSLVEEESSQDSDKTTNLLSSDCKVNKHSQSMHTSIPCTQYKSNHFNTQIKAADSSNPITTLEGNEKHNCNYENETVSRDNEYEMKYKRLETKYKFDKSKDAENIDEIFNFKHLDNGSNSDECLKPKTVENNTLTYHNIEHKTMVFDLPERVKECDKNSVNSYYPYEHFKKTDDIDKFNIGDSSKSLVEQHEKICEAGKCYEDTYLMGEKSEKDKIDIKYFDDPELYKNMTPVEGNENDVSKNSLKNCHCSSSYPNENYLLQNDIDNNADLDNKKDERVNYPQYLEDNETKSYTSKVIEEYKQEIASINNFHDLTLQDLRNKCNEFKNKIQFDPLVTEKFTNSYSSVSDDEKEIVLNSKLITKKSTPFKDRFCNVAKSNKDVNPRTIEHNDKFINSNIDENIERNFNSQNKEKQKMTKTKKKIKKKDSTHEYKTKYTNDDFKIKKSNNANKNVSDVKKHEEYSSSYPKTNKSVVKFKAQKITLVKSSTKMNHTVYMDNERDVVSWMATRINTPSGDMSSSDNTERNKSSKDSKYIEKEKPIRNSVHFEDEIVPVVKFKPTEIQIDDSVFTDPQYKTVITDRIEEIANTDSEIDIMKFSPPSDFSNSSDKFDFGKINEPRETIDMMEDNSMITDIYTTLHDIENHYNKSENETKNTVNKDIDENVTIEFKDIASYLEKMEKNANEDMTSLSHNQPLFAMKVEELMELSKAELAHRAVVGVLAAGRASAIASGLKGALARAAKVSAARLKAIKTSAKQDATITAAQTTQTLAKHQKFIEQLVEEKRALTERIEQLAGAAAGAEARRGRAARVAAERLQLELRNQRQRLNAAHQRDKQAWLKHHTLKIKEMTVKELEEELREIERKHAAQMETLKKDAEKTLVDLREEHAKDIRKMKDNAARQLEDELDKERLLATERLEQKRMEWEAAMISASERAGLEAKDAARRVEEAARNARRDSELWKLEKEEELSRQRRLLEKQIEEEKNNIKDEIKHYREKLTNEFEKYKLEYLKKQEVVLKEKESEIKLLLRRERDKEIEKAIDCMEKDAQESRKEMQETIRKTKEKYENGNRILEQSEKLANLRCDELREQIIKLQEQCTNQQITITQLEGKLKQADEINNQNSAQTDMLIKAAESKGQENVRETERKMEDLQKKHKDEMHQLFAKVKLVIARKDDALTLAKRETANIRERCMRLETKHI